ncbi:hypothetical protein EVAR_35484_1 [Eumeta japonica]|uniref:Uncharacterized protein n=1 Tax=Eumeta variegata TaxID=151549 RepID=A0A4C1X4P9_EUMVA|nr:hypothetical protein EVAR_35484_1 [Eumeta japonica]
MSGIEGGADGGAVGRKTRRRAAVHDAHTTLLGATPQAGDRGAACVIEVIRITTCRLLTPLGYPGTVVVMWLVAMWLGAAHTCTHKAHTDEYTENLDSLHLLGAVARPFGAEAGRRLS